MALVSAAAVSRVGPDRLPLPAKAGVHRRLLPAWGRRGTVEPEARRPQAETTGTCGFGVVAAESRLALRPEAPRTARKRPTRSLAGTYRLATPAGVPGGAGED